MEKEIKVGIHNCFDFVRRDAKTGEVLGEYKAENIILNNFWAKYLSTASKDCLKYIHFGSGTATPVATDVKLTTWVGYKIAPTYNNAGTVYDISKIYTDGVASVKKSIRLEDTELVGTFISEVGYSSSTSSTTGLLTKALVKDMNGNVVSIEKKSGEVLDIFATFYVNFGTWFGDGEVYLAQTQKATGSLLWAMLGYTLNGIYAAEAVYTQGRPQPQDGLANALAKNAYKMASVTPSFDIPNKKIYMSVGNLTASIGNVAGGIRGLAIGGILVNLPCAAITQPILEKEVVGTGDGSKKDFQTKFGYVKNNGTAKVFVNDVEVSAVIDYDQMYPKTVMTNDLEIIDYPKFDNTRQDTKVTVLGANTNYYAPDGTCVIAENKFSAIAPINSMYLRYAKASVSNDLENWVEVASVTSNGATRTIAAEYQNYRYWKFENTNTDFGIPEITSTVAATITNIHLASAPAEGDTVAVTYQPDCIAKDDQHVLNNVKVTLTFNEYTP